MKMTTRFANLLIDTADTLAQARDGEDAWAGVNAVAGRLNANAVNAGVFLRGTESIAWMRSSMKPGWLEEYAGAGLADTDPLLRASMAGAPPALYDVAARMPDRSGDARMRRLHARMLEHGYRYMLTHAWFEGPQNKCLVLSCEDDPADLFGPGTARAFSAVSAMLSYSVHPPGADNPAARAFGSEWRALTQREADVLAWLAGGLSEDAIADRIGRDRTEVSRVIFAASAKMRAESRDQAIALAMMRGLLAL